MSFLRVEGLAAHFASPSGVARAVDGVSFEVERGEIVGLVGESGSGKSATALAILRLLPRPGGEIAGGRAVFDGIDLTSLEDRSLRRIRGRRIAMIFQDPMTSLNPYLRVREQLVEVARRHLGISRNAAVARAVELLERAGIPEAPRRIRAYPHQLSGGMRQRVMIAMALLCDPELLIADEPTTALDVTIQAQILELLRELCEERQLSVLFITHDLGIVAGLCRRVLVMYAGRILEEAPVEELFARPGHPYTAALLRCVPRLDDVAGAPLQAIDGQPPSLEGGGFRGCSFAPRCVQVHDACLGEEPPLREEGGRRRRCVLPLEQVR